MNIILVRPPFVNVKNGPPIGIAYISRALKEAGYEVKVIDLNIDINKEYGDFGRYTRDFILPATLPVVSYAYSKLDEYCQEILSLSPDIVGFTLSYPTVDFGIEMAQKLSKFVRCIAGGPHAYNNPKKLLDLGCFDTIVSGYGEEAVLEAVNKKGIISKDLIKRKEYLPDYSDMPIKNYNGRLPVITTRGCPNRCYFCSQHFPYFYHSIESVVEQIEKTPNIKEVTYNDSNINVNVNRTRRLFTELGKIENPPRGHIFGVEINEGFKKYVSKMAEGGIKEVRMGIESGSIRERKSMNKMYFENDLVVEFIKELTENKILALAQFIFCYPDQTESDREETIKLMQRINETCDANYVKYNWYRFVVHYGTEKLFKEKYGVISSSPRQWKNSLYSPGTVKKIAAKYSEIIPGNARIFFD